RLATMTRSPVNWNADAPRRSHASAKRFCLATLQGRASRSGPSPSRPSVPLPCRISNDALLAHLPLPHHCDLDEPAARQYGRIEYGGLPVGIAIPTVVQRASTTSTDTAPLSSLVYLFGSGR